FQAPLQRLIRVMREPLIAIRYGNAMWTPRGFEIWMFKWPGLIWSFSGFTPESRAAVYAREPWRAKKKVLLFRALGGYGRHEFQRCVTPSESSVERSTYAGNASLPPGLLSSLASFYYTTINTRARSDLYDLSRSRFATRFSRYFARLLRL